VMSGEGAVAARPKLGKAPPGFEPGMADLQSAAGRRRNRFAAK
jgi:hypothetical protein